MADNIDSFIPGVLHDPLKGYEELKDILDPVTGRLIGIAGVLGMKIEDGARHAETWWDERGRQQMPDHGKSDAYLNAYGIKSGILLGLPWARLNRGERIAVVKNWHTHIGIPKNVLSVNNKQELNNVLEQIQRDNAIRQFDLAGIFGAPARDGDQRH